MWFSAQIVDRDRSTVITLHGELDIETKAVLVGVVDGALNAGVKRLLLDLSDLAFIDTAGATGVRLMVDKAQRLGVDLRIASPSELATMVLALSGLRDVVHAPVAVAADRT